MKTSRFRWSYRKNASKLHRAVGECLRQSQFFKNQEIYQEYPVNRVFTLYKESSHHFDWVIPKLKIVIECHGQQHYQPVAFDGDYDAAVANFGTLQYRDRTKKQAALDANYRYVEIPYTDMKTITIAYILGKIDTADKELKEHSEESTHELEVVDQRKVEQSNFRKSKHKEFLASDKHKEELAKARIRASEYRKEQYRRFKELKNSE